MLNKSEILAFVTDSPKPVTKREVARAFGVKGGENRVALKQILKQLEEEGVIAKQAGGAYSVPRGLPSVTVIEVSDIDLDGDVFARIPEWDEGLQGPPPRIEIMPDKKGHPALTTGDRVLARLSRVEDGAYEARTIKRLDGDRGRVMGILKMHKNGAVLAPTHRKAKYDFDVPQAELNGAKEGDLIVGEIQPARSLKRKKVRIVERLGSRDDVNAISLISLHEAGLRSEFSPEVIKESEKLKAPDVKGREDLRDIPLVTIDGADARDFDDAVFAQETKDGFHLIVAIADVAYYVRPDSALDREAQKRGNSTYFPDRVLPMLPEILSNDLCSLRPNEERACMAVHMWIDRAGHLQKYKFVRGLMKSAARLTYEEVQAAHDGKNEALASILDPLYAAYEILDQARQKRGALDLDLPERQIIIDDKGRMSGVKQRVRLDAHKLIEEFMILANVAAAKALEAKRAPCVYRVHDRPSADKLGSAREFLESFGLSLPKVQVAKPTQINQVLREAAKMPYSHLISTVILRTQSQAIYSPENMGHFGLALDRYAHFTSPIRRYADLLVHRALIGAYGLGPGALDDREAVQLERICADISSAERASMGAERSAIDRFTASFLSEQIGAQFAGRITGVTRFGLFVELAESGADGLVPMRSLPEDFYVHDERAHALVGRKKGRVFRLGAEVNVRIKETNTLTGSTVLQLAGHEKGADIPGMKKPKIEQDRRGGRGKPPRHKKYKKRRK